MSKKKISVEQAGQTIANPLSNAFDGLTLPDLPPASTSAPEQQAAQVERTALGSLRIRRSTAHRGGKCVVVVDEFPATMRTAHIDELAAALRRACSTGGTCKDRTVELQGQQLDKVRAYLKEHGWRVRG